MEKKNLGNKALSAHSLLSKLSFLSSFQLFCCCSQRWISPLSSILLCCDGLGGSAWPEKRHNEHCSVTALTAVWQTDQQTLHQKKVRMLLRIFWSAPFLLVGLRVESVCNWWWYFWKMNVTVTPGTDITSIACYFLGFMFPQFAVCRVSCYRTLKREVKAGH